MQCGAEDSQEGAVEITTLEVSLTRLRSSFSFVTLDKFLSLPITEEVGAELAQPLLMLTFHHSLERIQFHGGLKVDTFLG